MVSIDLTDVTLVSDDTELVKGTVLCCCFFGVEVVRPVLVMVELCAATCANLIDVFLMVEVGVLVVLVLSFWW